MKELRIGRVLTPAKLESVLKGASILTKDEGGWVPEAREGLFIDLSETEFAELSAMGQIAVLVDGAARHRIPVSVALPLPRPRIGEARFIDASGAQEAPDARLLADRARNRILFRQNTLGFMHRLGFIDAIRVQHVPQASEIVKILSDYDSGIESDNKPTQSQGVTTTDYFHELDDRFTVKRIFRFQWFSVLSQDELDQVTRRAATILGLPEFGLPRVDANAIATNILHELVENVYNHSEDADSLPSCHPHCLIGALMLDPAHYHLTPEQFRPRFRDFIAWAADTQSPIVRIVVADSGCGLVNRLAPHFGPANEPEVPPTGESLTQTEKILFWAFNRWSTSSAASVIAKRGTRGLWRVRRFVRAYSGAVTIRTSDATAGWTYYGIAGGRPLHETRLRLVPGTLLDVWLLPSAVSTQVRAGNFTDAPGPDVKFELVVWPSDGALKLRDDHLRSIVQRLAVGGSGQPVCVVVCIDAFPLDPQQSHQLLADALTVGTELANHGSLALLCTGMRWRQIDPIAESLQLDAQIGLHAAPNQDDSLFISRSPVVVLDAVGEGRWLGGPPAVRSILNKRWQSHMESVVLSEAPEYPDLVRIPEGELQDFLDHPDVIKPNKTGFFQARFQSGDIDTFITTQVAAALVSAVVQISEGVRRGTFLTPTLEIVNRWIDVSTLIQSTLGPGIVTYALASKARRSQFELTRDNATMIGVDIRSPELTAGLSANLGLGPVKYSIPGELGAYDYPVVPRVPPGMNVVVFADLVLTENTVRHALTDLTRWGAQPRLVLCVLDARRRKTSAIRCLGKEIPIIALADVELVSPTSSLAEERQPIDAVSGEAIETSGPQRADYEIPPSLLLEWCRQQEGLLYLGHIERSVRRHFSTYLNPGRLIEHYRRTIVDKYIKHIGKWLDVHANEGDVTEIWHPGPSMILLAN